MKTNSRFLVALSILIVTVLLSEPLITPANAGTQDQEDTNNQDYPIAFHPGPDPHPIFEKHVTRETKFAIESSLEFIDVNLKPLISEKVNRVEFWIGSDLGYIIAERRSFNEGSSEGIYHWSGKILNIQGFGTVSLTFGKDERVVGEIRIGLRVFLVQTLIIDGRKTSFLFEVDNEKAPGIRDAHDWSFLNRPAPAKIIRLTKKVIPVSKNCSSKVNLLSQLEKQKQSATSFSVVAA